MEILSIIQIAVSLALIVLILMQQRGGGMSLSFMGEGGGFHYSKRGIEKKIFYATIFTSIVFFGLLIANLIL